MIHMDKIYSMQFKKRYSDNSKCLRVSKDNFQKISSLSKEMNVPMSSITNALLAIALSDRQE